MKLTVKACLIFLILIILLGCGGSAKTLKLGDCDLTITVKADGKEFDGFANVYINGLFIGTTDAKSQTLKIRLKKGEYVLIVTAPGCVPWRSKITLLGGGYKQTALARLNKKTDPATDPNEKQVH